MSKKISRVTVWTKEVLREAKRRFPNENTHDLADALGVSFEAFKKKAYRLGWRKSQTYLRSLGRTN
jgi:hypothetical protein